MIPKGHLAVMAAATALIVVYPAHAEQHEDPPKPKAVVEHAEKIPKLETVAAKKIEPVVPPSQTEGVSSSGDHLDEIAQCESGGDPAAINPSGKYRGAFQFDYQTWQANGGSGDPAQASYEEQKRIAASLYERRGSQPWPNCG